MFNKVTINAIMGFLIVILAFILFYALIFKKIEGDSRDIVLFVLGSVSTILSQVISYYFGSSKGSADKTKMMGEVIKQNSPSEDPNPPTP